MPSNRFPRTVSFDFTEDVAYFFSLRTDPTVNQNLNTLGRQLASAGAAGTGVLANCN